MSKAAAALVLALLVPGCVQPHQGTGQQACAPLVPVEAYREFTVALDGCGRVEFRGEGGDWTDCPRDGDLATCDAPLGYVRVKVGGAVYSVHTLASHPFDASLPEVVVRSFNAPFESQRPAVLAWVQALTESDLDLRLELVRPGQGPEHCEPIPVRAPAFPDGFAEATLACADALPGEALVSATAWHNGSLVARGGATKVHVR